MAQIGCVCGHQISDTTDHSPYKWTLISDRNQERAVEEIIRVVNTNEDLANAYYAPDRFGVQAHVCPKCRRLLVFKEGKSSDETVLAGVYTPDN